MPPICLSRAEPAISSTRPPRELLAVRYPTELPLQPNSADIAGPMMGISRFRNAEMVCRVKIAATGMSQAGAARFIGLHWWGYAKAAASYDMGYWPGPDAGVTRRRSR